VRRGAGSWNWLRAAAVVQSTLNPHLPARFRLCPSTAALAGWLTAATAITRATASTLVAATALAACTTPPASTDGASAATAAPAAPAPSAPALTIEPSPPAPPPARIVLTIMAGGDVSFGRDLGQTLLREPNHDFFTAVAPLFTGADVRFVNLESQLSDQRGETQSPWVKLVFTGPPAGAGALARAGVDVVSTANNHAWDYGRKGLLETLENLDRAGIAHAGTGRSRPEAYQPAIVDRAGFRLALFAVTDIWNQGSLRTHKAAEYVARAETESLVAAVREARARPDIDLVLVSYHGGVEYLDLPLARTRTLLHAAIDAGAAAVLGHHPHVAQGIEWYKGHPILYSLGNLVMQMSDGRPPPTGYLARLRLSRSAPPLVEACPLRFPASSGKPLTGHPGRTLLEKRFFSRLKRVSVGLGGIEVGESGDDGCAPVRAAPATEPAVAQKTTAAAVR
jgi:hypothetical protein